MRIDWPALVRGYTMSGEICEITGLGPVPVAAVRDMIDSGDPFLAAVVTKGVDVASVIHLGRRATATQMTALEWLSPKCSNLGCNNTARLEIDHVRDWAATHVTRLAHLAPLCHHCHRLKTLAGWALVEGTGRRPLVAPDDPRHPRHGRYEPSGNPAPPRAGGPPN